MGIIYYVLLVLLTAGIGYISLGKGFEFNIYPSFAGDGTNDEFVDFLYQNLLGRELGADEHALWVEEIEDGTERQSVFSSFLRSSEFRANQGFDAQGEAE